MKCLENLKIQAKKAYYPNEQIEEAAEELYNELLKIKNSNNIGELTDNQHMESEDIFEETINDNSCDMNID
jgi:hypothetical protein